MYLKLYSELSGALNSDLRVEKIYGAMSLYITL